MRSKLNIKPFLMIVLLLAIVIGLVFLIRYIVITCKYSYYQGKMQWYTFDKLYDNESAKSTESVASDEIAKMVVGVLYNRTHKDYAEQVMSYVKSKNLSTNEWWLELAKFIPLNSADNIVMGKGASKLDAAKLLVEGIEEVLKKEIKITEPLGDKYRSKYSANELELIDKAISIGLLENSSSDINKRNILKGELNKMLITVLEDYSTVYYKNRFDVNTEAKLVTDEGKLPKNADKYPYIVDNIQKELYEIEPKEMISDISDTPKKVYDVYHEEYNNTEANIESYFNVILNIDYRTINTDDIINKLNQYMAYNLETEILGNKEYRKAIDKYVKYVKDNEIILSGKVTTFLPIIYSNGLVHFVRSKIELTVVNSKTNKNLLLWDGNVTYNKRDIQVYTDIAVTPSFYTRAFRILNSTSCMAYVIKDDNNSITIN